VSSPDRRQSVRVMTWNIHGAIGRNPRFDLSRVVALILRADPDIIALQEVDSRGGSEDPFTLLQNALGTHGVGAKSIATADGEYGQMLISRWPMQETEIRDISYGEFEPRRAIRARVETPFGPLCVVATHLGLSVRERRSQARALLDMIGNASPFVALGDFNDWFWPGSVRSVLRHALPGRSRHRTFPAWCPLLRLDRIYCRPREALVQTWTDGQARHVSDHLPVIGDVLLADAQKENPALGRVSHSNAAGEYIRPRHAETSLTKV
jgi:endonuclease/exonuclease/phosphatase family metal-dependent hydrolase